ncbi:MAG TPA: YihY/virulence factor BrkB family protein [Bryobacteraceae bacterium]|nr:YihY/virulence factor BrkB family protein [Bryobacteraceae bacterium]
MRWVWSLGGLSPGELARRVWVAIDSDALFDRAAQLSYYFLLALFPLLICLSALLGFLFAGKAELYHDLLRYLQSAMPSAAYQLVRATVDEITIGASGNKLSLGLAATLWTASSGMEALINGLNVAYDVKERRSWWRRRIVAIVLTVMVAVMTTLALSLALAGGHFGRILAERFGLGDVFAVTWALAQLVLPLVFMLVVCALIYRFAPNVREHGWQALMPGAFVAVTLWFIATSLFRFYLSVFDSYSKTYGSLGAVIVLLLWLYLCGAAVLIGGEVNAEIRKAAAAAGAEEAQKPIEA